MEVLKAQRDKENILEIIFTYPKVVYTVSFESQGDTDI